MSLLLQFIGYGIDEDTILRMRSKQKVVITVHSTKFDGFIACILGVLFGDNICTAVTKNFMDHWILGPILSRFGCFSIKSTDAGGKLKTVDAICEHMMLHPTRSICISPEGSTSAREWKSGFYHVANTLKIPIVVGGVDYINHQIVLDKNEFIPTGDYEKDLPLIKDIFRRSKVYPRFAKNSNPEILTASCLPAPSYISNSIVFKWMLVGISIFVCFIRR